MNGEPTLPQPFRLTAYDTIGSTNDEAKRLARTGAAEGTIVCAKVQTAGRGRRGRAWESPAGNLYCSVLLRPHCPAAVAAQLGFVAAIALAEAIAALAPAIELRCKWPNDLLANGGKVSGILLETEMATGEVPEFVVIGSGVNLAAAPRGTPYPATSLAAEGAAEITPANMLAAYVRRFAVWWRRWQDNGFVPVREAWLSRAVGLGAAVQVRLERDTLEGRFVDLGADGALMLDMAEGRRRVTAGEIFPVSG